MRIRHAEKRKERHAVNSRIGVFCVVSARHEFIVIERIARRIAKTAKRAGRNILSQFAQSRFVPMHTEMIFGKNGIAPIMLELADGSFVYLQGRIDRIDVLDEKEKRIRVIDYKTGKKEFRLCLRALR